MEQNFQPPKTELTRKQVLYVNLYESLSLELDNLEERLSELDHLISANAGQDGIPILLYDRLEVLCGIKYLSGLMAECEVQSCEAGLLQSEDELVVKLAKAESRKDVSAIGGVVFQAYKTIFGLRGVLDQKVSGLEGLIRQATETVMDLANKQGGNHG